MKLKTSNHTFEFEEKDYTNVYLHGVLEPDLYYAILRNSKGYMKIHPKSCKENLERLKDINPGEIELLDIINRLMDQLNKKQFMIVFRR